MESLGATINRLAVQHKQLRLQCCGPPPPLDRRWWLLACVLIPMSPLLLVLLPTEISEYEEGRRRSLSVQEGSTVLIECPLPHSVPPARPRLKVRGERIEVSTGVFERHIFLGGLYFECMLPTRLYLTTFFVLIILYQKQIS